MDELIKMFVEDVNSVKDRMAKRVVGDGDLNKMLLAFKCSLGRVLLQRDGEDGSNTDRAYRTADEYLATH